MTKPALYHVLTTALLVDSSVFNKARPAEQTAAILAANGKPVVFCDSLATLKSRKRLRDKLLAGEDVTIELEVCGIELSQDDLAVLRAVRPLLERIGTTAYPWLPEEFWSQEFTTACQGTIIRRSSSQGNYNISVKAAKRAWTFASRYWQDGIKPEQNIEVAAYGYRRDLEIYDDRVQIGCQTITRGKVEYLARLFNWDTPS